MRYLGKLLGFIAGWVLAGPLGALFGLLIGQYFDLAAVGYWNQPQQRYQRTVHGFRREDAQQAFLRATFLVMGHIAKADGRVSEGEIAAARSIMRNMLLSANMKREAMELFTQGRDAQFNYQETINKLIQACRGQHEILRMFIDIQFQTAAAEGPIGPHKRKILEDLCQRLGFRPLDFFTFNQGQQQYQQGSRQSYRSTGYQRASQGHTVTEDPYKTLGISPKANDAEIKKAYRKKISENHPDKLVAKGLPEEMIKLANKKTAEIKKAYDTIASTRGIK